MSWREALKETARSGLTIHVDRSALNPLMALRGALGVAVVIGVPLALGSPALAVSSAFGGFASGVATFQRSWRPRPVLALGAAAGLAVSTFLGYLLAAHTPAFVVLLAVWAFAAGMSWGLGPTAGTVSALTVACMLVTVTLPTTVLGALTHAGLIATGGLVQAALIVLLPVRPWGERRDALADALAAVADYARRLRHDPQAPFHPEALMTAREAAAVTAGQARRRPRQLGGYRGLAERFRPVLASLADPVVGAPLVGPERDRARELLAAAATVLDATARAIRRGERVRIPRGALEVLQVPAAGPVMSGPARKAGLRLIALTDEAVEAAAEPVEVTRPLRLFPRAVWHLPTRPGSPDSDAYADPDAAPGQGARERARAAVRYLDRPSLARLAPAAVRAFRRELRWSSPICRHAVRVAAVVSLGYLLGAALPPKHGYWVPLTAVMILRPDFSQTYSRGVARCTGTLIGVGIAGAIMAVVQPQPYAPYLSAALAVLALALNYTFLSSGYAVVAGCVGAYVVFLLGVAGVHWSQTVVERIWLTALGGLVALLSYAVFPAWETPRLRDRLADWLAATARYTTAVLETYADPAGTPSAAEATGTPPPRPGTAARRVRNALLDVRAARSAWEQSASRAGAEPVRHRGRLSRLSRRSATEAQDALVTLGRVTMLLEAHIPDRDAAPSRGAGTYAAALAATAGPAERALRDAEPLDWGPVHTALADWQTRESAHPAGPSVALRTAELITDALDELADAARVPQD